MKLVIFLCLFIQNFAVASTCNNINNEYDFKYSFNKEENLFNYKILRKDLKFFSYYEPAYKINNHFPTEMFYYYKNYSGKELSTINNVEFSSESEREIYNKAKLFYFGDNKNNLFTNNYIIFNKVTFIRNNNFINTKEINYSINLDDFSQHLKGLSDTNFLEEADDTNDLRIQIKIILDPAVNNCLIFETEKINYNTPSVFKSLIYFGKDFSEFFQLNLKAIK